MNLKTLSSEDKLIEKICDEKLDYYYSRITK